MYKLELNPAQAYVVIAALDVLSRIGMGQLEAVAEHLPPHRLTILPHNNHEILAEIRGALNYAKRHLGHLPGSSYGMGHDQTTPEAKIAWDIQCVLRKAVATAEKHGSHSVWHHEPVHYGREPLATVTT